MKRPHGTTGPPPAQTVPARRWEALDGKKHGGSKSGVASDCACGLLCALVNVLFTQRRKSELICEYFMSY